jgi:hypothetical protein
MIPPPQRLRLGAGLEASDFRRSFGRHDIAALYGFNDRFREDLALLKEHGFRLLRVGTRWYQANPAPGIFDWSYLDPLWEEIVRLDLEPVPDLFHYGYPDWIDEAPGSGFYGPALLDGLTAWCAAFVERYRPALVSPCNEPRILAMWQETGGGYCAPFTDDCETWTVRQLARATIAACGAVHELGCRTLITEPWHSGKGVEAEIDWHAAVLDRILGQTEPELGGHPDVVDIIGLNYYPFYSRWPLDEMIRKGWERFHKPLWIGETTHPLREAEWFDRLVPTVLAAQAEGIPIDTVILYPIIDFIGWEPDVRWDTGGLWRVGEHGERLRDEAYWAAIQRQRAAGHVVS